MNLRQLRTFVLVAEAGGFARAVSRLHLSQPAASRQIEALQDDLGVKLFERVGRRIRLTSDGEDLLRRSRTVLADAEALEQRARALKGGRAGILRVGATPQAIENMLADFLKHYRRGHPDVDVRLVEEGGARLQARLAQGDVHLAIMGTGDARFAERVLYPMHVFAVVPKGHRLSRKVALDVTELADSRLMVGTGFASRVWFEAACQLAHVKPQIVLESAAPHTMIALVRAGYGIAVLPSPASIPADAVRAIPVVHRGASIGRWSVIAWDPQRYLPRYAEDFVDELAARCAKTYPGRALTRRLPRAARVLPPHTPAPR
ncbi:MAG TPA: LysR family transcriptional regulator [Burkholderiales bacterium]|nr:LysR family transcriptional regulator [Burkholderiales bacterium]